MQLPEEPSTSSVCRKIILFGCTVGIIAFLMYFHLHERPSIPVSYSLLVWHTNEQRQKQPAYINNDHGFCGPCPADKQSSDAWQLANLAHRIAPSNRFIVNIGAASASGGQYDPTYPLLVDDSSFGALLVDPNTNPSLFNAYPKRSNIRIVHDFVWAESVAFDIFEQNNISKNFAILKLDIDSYECTVLESILKAGYRPQVIHTEFNPIFPPPIIFMPVYQSKTKTDWKPPLYAINGPFYGCSLHALSKTLAAFDYILLQVEFWDTVFVHREIAHSVHLQVPANDHVAYQQGFIDHPCLPYCQHNPKLYNDHLAVTIQSTINGSNFTANVKVVMDLFTPISTKNGVKHPYEIRLDRDV